METLHSSVSPSTSKYWAHCAGSVALCANIYKPNTEYRKEGSAAHETAALFLKTGEWQSKNVPFTNGYMLTEEMEKYVRTYINDVKRITEKRLQPAENVETRIAISRIHPNCFGTCDLWYYDSIHKILYVWDFKYGWAPVKIFENYQLIMYAIGLLDKITTGNGLANDITVNMRICQPRAPHVDGPIREWRIKAMELKPYADHLIRQATAIYEPDPPLVTGEHCKNCDGLVICPAATQAALNAVDVSVKYTDPELLNIGRHWEILKRAKEAIFNQFDAIETYAIQSIKDGVIIPELDVQSSRGSTNWQVDNDNIFTMGDLLGVDLRQPEKPCTPKQAVDKGIPKEVVNLYSGHKAGKLKLVKHDSRKAKEVLKR
jgi:hypothetical protein